MSAAYTPYIDTHNSGEFTEYGTHGLDRRPVIKFSMVAPVVSHQEARRLTEVYNTYLQRQMLARVRWHMREVKITKADILQMFDPYWHVSDQLVTDMLLAQYSLLPQKWRPLTSQEQTHVAIYGDLESKVPLESALLRELLLEAPSTDSLTYQPKVHVFAPNLWRSGAVYDPKWSPLRHIPEFFALPSGADSWAIARIAAKPKHHWIKRHQDHVLGTMFGGLAVFITCAHDDALLNALSDKLGTPQAQSRSEVNELYFQAPSWVVSTTFAGQPEEIKKAASLIEVARSMGRGYTPVYAFTSRATLDAARLFVPDGAQRMAQDLRKSIAALNEQPSLSRAELRELLNMWTAQVDDYDWYGDRKEKQALLRGSVSAIKRTLKKFAGWEIQATMREHMDSTAGYTKHDAAALNSLYALGGES